MTHLYAEGQSNAFSMPRFRPAAGEKGVLTVQGHHTDAAMLILAAEGRLEDVVRLRECLAILGEHVRMATSADEVMEHLRRDIFTRAVVAVELAWGCEPMLARISRLPVVEHLVAIGPPDDTRMEARARTAGAGAYVARPVTVRVLAMALGARSQGLGRQQKCLTRELHGGFPKQSE
jgi:hypothetical protein